MEDAGKFQQDIDREIERIQEEQRKDAEKYTSEIDNQVNSDLAAQLKNLYDHLPSDYLEKVKGQEAIIKNKGSDLKKEGDAQASKISSETDKIIGNNSSHMPN